MDQFRHVHASGEGMGTQLQLLRTDLTEARNWQRLARCPVLKPFRSIFQDVLKQCGQFLRALILVYNSYHP